MAPYHSRNATKVARNLSPFEGNQAQALQQLPNFKTSLNIAKNEANMFGNSNKHIMIILSNQQMMVIDMSLVLKPLLKKAFILL